MREKWKPVVGYENHYLVSNLGRVKSKSRRVKYGTGTRIVIGKILTPAQNKRTKYLYIGLCKQNKPLKRYVHQLVLEAFVGPRPLNADCCHAPDPNKANNTLRNLRWDSRKSNIKDSMNLGNWPRGKTWKHIQS